MFCRSYLGKPSKHLKGRSGLGLLSLILKSLIISLMQKSDIGAYIAAADVLAG